MSPGILHPFEQAATATESATELNAGMSSAMDFASLDGENDMSEENGEEGGLFGSITALPQVESLSAADATLPPEAKASNVPGVDVPRRAAPRHTGSVLTLLKAVRKGKLTEQPPPPMDPADLLTVTLAPILIASPRKRVKEGPISASEAVARLPETKEARAARKAAAKAATKAARVAAKVAARAAAKAAAKVAKVETKAVAKAAAEAAAKAAADAQAETHVDENVAVEDRDNKKRKRLAKGGRQRHLDVGTMDEDSTANKSSKQAAEESATSSRNRNIGRRVATFQQSDQTWYNGEVIGFRASAGLFLVRYDDGGKAWERVSGSDTKFITPCVDTSSNDDSATTSLAAHRTVYRVVSRKRVRAPSGTVSPPAGPVDEPGEAKVHICDGCGRSFGKACWLGNHRKRCAGATFAPTESASTQAAPTVLETTPGSIQSVIPSNVQTLGETQDMVDAALVPGVSPSKVRTLDTQEMIDAALASDEEEQMQQQVQEESLASQAVKEDSSQPTSNISDVQTANAAPAADMVADAAAVPTKLFSRPCVATESSCADQVAVLEVVLDSIVAKVEATASA
jgi:hypothetical protein